MHSLFSFKKQNNNSKKALVEHNFSVSKANKRSKTQKYYNYSITSASTIFVMLLIANQLFYQINIYSLAYQEKI